MARALLVMLLLALLPAVSARGVDAVPEPQVPSCVLAVDAAAGKGVVRAVACVEASAMGLPQVATGLRVALPDPLLAGGEPARAPEPVAPRSAGPAGGSPAAGAPPQGSPVADAAAGMSGAAALVALGWTVLRLLGLAPLLPFFSRIEDGDLAAHPARRAALDLIQASPGATLQDIQRALGLAWGTTVHHLRRLERAGLIAVRRDGGRRGHWPLGQAPPRDGLSSADRAVAALVKSSPGLTQRDIARLSGVGAPAACKRLARLEEAGLVAQVREGRNCLYVPTGRLVSLDVAQSAASSIVRSVASTVAGTPATAQAATPQAVAGAGQGASPTLERVCVRRKMLKVKVPTDAGLPMAE